MAGAGVLSQPVVGLADVVCLVDRLPHFAGKAAFSGASYLFIPYLHGLPAGSTVDNAVEDVVKGAGIALHDGRSAVNQLLNLVPFLRRDNRFVAQRECEKLEVRNQEIDDLFLNLYTDKAKGILSEQRFLKLTSAMEQEQEANRKRLQDLSLLIRRTESQESDVQTFIHEIRQYAAIQELDEAMLHRLISRIVVGEMKKVDGQKQQEVKIIYNFVGEIPE